MSSPSAHSDSPRRTSRAAFRRAAERYIGTPWCAGGRSREGADCYGLLYLLYLEVWNIELPWASPTGHRMTRADMEDIDRMVRGALPQWVPVDAPEAGDLVVLEIGGRACHLGVSLGDDQMLTTYQGAGAAIESWRNTRWKNRLDGFYRYPIPSV